MYKITGTILRSLTGLAYKRYGLNKVTLLMSQILDIFIIAEQRKELIKYETSN